VSKMDAWDFIEDSNKHIGKTHKDKYAVGGVETIDLIASKFDLMSFALGNVIKYVSRFPETRNPEDLLKAGHYLAMVYTQFLEEREKESGDENDTYTNR